MVNIVTIQVGNWRVPQIQVLDQNQTPIDLTGVTGNIVWTDPADVPTSYAIPVVLGKFSSPSTAAADAINGYCYAAFETVDLPGLWSEQAQLILPGFAEPLNGPVVYFTVNANLVP